MQSGGMSAAIIRFNELLQAVADYRNKTIVLVDHSTATKEKYLLCVHSRDAAGRISSIPIGTLFTSEIEDLVANNFEDKA